MPWSSPLRRSPSWTAWPWPSPWPSIVWTSPLSSTSPWTSWPSFRCEPPQRQRVALHPEADEHAARVRGDVAVVPELLTFVHVRDVHLQQGRVEHRARVRDRDRV